MATVGDILAILNGMAPPELAEEWDNPGLLVGRADQQIEAALLCVDATEAVVREARQRGAGLIVAHHPLMFRAIKRVRDDEPEGHVICELIRAGVSMIAAHTNLDMASGGVNDALAAALGLEDAVSPEPLLRAGRMEGTLREVRERVERALDTRALSYGPEDMRVTRVALCSGAGGSELAAAARCGAQAFITGELKHSDLILARQLGLGAICAGHFETERVVLSPLANGLQSRLDALQYNVKVYVSGTNPLA